MVLLLINNYLLIEDSLSGLLINKLAGLTVKGTLSVSFQHLYSE